ncbi:hypothetical protein BJY04DRAFT_221755 [Aspergillus karnatakaensis]|uniref:uncharacterized protein n=1 Tax=Aspergillus karnatakaensis TaxID=1810916 RepID=UPI003CCDF30E
MTVTTENTPLLGKLPESGKKRTVFSPASRILIASFLISVALSFTQVPILYAFRLMTCDEFYRNEHTPGSCTRNEIDVGTATQVSILGLSTAFCGVLNLFFAGWQIKNWGPKTALVVQTAFPALRGAIQAIGVAVGYKEGIIIVQASQLITLMGGQSGYLLVLNTAAGEVVSVSERTGMFGMLQGSVMLGTSIGYLLGGIVGDISGIRRPFEVAAILFSLSSVYSGTCVPSIKIPQTPTDTKSSGWEALVGGLKVLAPKRIRLDNGKSIRHYGITLLGLGVFMGVLATGYAPILIQMYATAVFNFQPTENGYLMATNSVIRGIFLFFLFPKIISAGRRWFSTKGEKTTTVQDSPVPIPTHPEDFDPVAGILSEQEPPKPLVPVERAGGQEFDLFFLRWSLLVDGLATAYTAFATAGWQIYIAFAAGFLLPLASGSAPAAKGVITEMCEPSERADALQAMTLVENIAMLSTLGLFGLIFSTFADMGKAYLTFYCNAAVAFVAVGILFMSRFSPKARRGDA